MPYTAEISRADPACFLFLVDQSGSMTEALAGRPGERKMDQAAVAINRILYQLVQRCAGGDTIKEYFHIGAIGYHTDRQASPIITSVLKGTTSEQPFLPISQVADVEVVVEFEERQVKESDGAGGLVEVSQRFPVWLRPHAEYGTPMVTALQFAANAVEDWVEEHLDSFPPIIINVSDGMAGDGNPEEQAQRLTDLRTSDGNVLLFNIHLSEVNALPIEYPDSDEFLPRDDDFALPMFRMSSVLPEPIRAEAASLGITVRERSRGYVFNANMESLAQFLEIGTRAASNLH